MKRINKLKVKVLSRKIGSTLIAAAMIATPAIASFTQAQPVANKKAKSKAKVKKSKTKKKKSYKAKAGTVNLKAITLTKGKSKTISVKSKSKVTWKTSNKSVVTVKSISKSKVKVYAKKAGSANVTGKAGSAKWSFTVKVKGNKKPIVKPTGKDTKKKTNTAVKKTNASQEKVNVRISGIQNNETIEFDTPGDDENNYIYVDSSFGKNIKFKSSDTSVLGIKALNDDFLVSTASCQLIPYKEGNAVITISAPGYSKDYSVHVKASEAYKKVEGFISKVNSSGLDDAHKAFVTAKWLEKRVSYGESDTPDYFVSTIINGKGVCSDYAKTYEWLLKLENIKSRRINTGSIGDHEWNQICVNEKWYNVDVSNNDEEPFNPEGAECFMKSDNCSNEFFSDRRHAVKYRSGDGNYPVTATATDYDNYDWASFANSEQFKSLINQ